MALRILSLTTTVALCAAALAPIGPCSPLAWADRTPPETLAEARAAFRRASCTEAAPWLSDILYPTPRLARTNDLIEAHLLLAACRLQAGDRDSARREFEEALFLDRATDVDPLVFSSDVVQFFRETKLALTERERGEAEKRLLAESKEKLRKFRESLVFVERRSFAVNFVPLGAGQFQNKQRTKAMISFIGQAATGSASIGVWAYLVGKYGNKGNVPPEDARGVRRLQQLGIGFGVAFYALYAWSVVDAMANYQPQVKVEADESWLDDAMPPAARIERATAKPARHGARVVPLVSLDQAEGIAAGLGVAWER